LPELYQGPIPPPGNTVAGWGFDALVLAAKEYQPAAALYPGVRVIRARLDDSGLPMTEGEWQQAVRAGEAVADVVMRCGRVLVTCAMGRNRSGLVSGLVIHMLTGLPGVDVVSEIRRLRPGALSNRWFVAALEHLPGRRRMRRSAEEQAW
jgi:protein-tyrosine phosphatase